MNYQPQWLRNEVLDGLSKLVTLSLDRTPAVDVIAGTAETWMEAICHRREWHEAQDRMRVRQAFATLAATCTTWPNPKLFLEAMPARMTQRERLALMSPEEVERREESRERVNEMLAQFGQRIGVNVSEPKQSPHQTATVSDDFPRCCDKGTREQPLCDDCRAWAQEVHGHGGER
jgi:hypothetical protein